jgi:hypothetical protein
VRIYQRPAFARAMRKLTTAQQEAVKSQARRTADLIGYPHLHSGTGLRPFGHYKEFRAGLDLRCLFLVEGGDMHLVMVGNHDAIASYIRNNG